MTNEQLNELYKAFYTDSHEVALRAIYNAGILEGSEHPLKLPVLDPIIKDATE